MSVLDKLNAVPTYHFNVPSTGETIKFRPFLHKEEKVLQIAKNTNDMDQYLQAIKDTIKACSYGSFDVDNAPTYDIEEFFLALRAKSVGETMNITLICQHPDEHSREGICGGEAETTIPLETIHIDRDLIKKDKYIVKLNDETSIEFTPPNFETMSKIIKFREDPENADILEIVTSMVKSIFTENEIYTASDYTHEELKSFLENLTSQQIDEMLDIIKNTPTIFHQVEVECPKCHRPITYQFNGLYDFFV